MSVARICRPMCTVKVTSPPASCFISSVTRNSCISFCRVSVWYLCHSASRAEIFSAWSVNRIDPSLIARKQFPSGRTASLKALTNSSILGLLRRTIHVVTTTAPPAALRKVQWGVTTTKSVEIVGFTLAICGVDRKSGAKQGNKRWGRVG